MNDNIYVRVINSEKMLNTISKNLKVGHLEEVETKNEIIATLENDEEKSYEEITMEIMKIHENLHANEKKVLLKVLKKAPGSV